jgi:tetraacyldisaccharide 4'-kinase
VSLLAYKRALEAWVLGAWYDGAARSWAQVGFTAVLAPLGWLVARVARQRRQRAFHVAMPLTPEKADAASPVGPHTGALPPVVVVGNLTVGGTGKTPLVAWLAAQLQAHGKKVGLVSRGYGRGAATVRRVASGDSAALVGDEPAWLAANTGCAVAVGQDRVAALRLLAGEVDVVLADDGLQHHALPRRLEIIVIDATRAAPLGNGRCLPAGPLRELPDFVGPEQVVLCNHGAASVAQLAAAPVPAWASTATVLHFAVQPQVAVNLVTGESRSLASFTGAVAVAGIGHPERFFQALRTADAGVHHCVPFSDHHAYTAADLATFAGMPVLMTAKDAVKCVAFAAPNWWRVEAVVAFAPGEGERLLRAVLSALE